VIKVGLGLVGKGGKGVMMVRERQRPLVQPIVRRSRRRQHRFGSSASNPGLTALLVFASRRSIGKASPAASMTLGAEAGIAAGPVGRQASGSYRHSRARKSDSYSRSQGFFRDCGLDGSVTIAIGNSANAALLISKAGIYASDIFSANAPAAPSSLARKSFPDTMRCFPGLNDKAPTAISSPKPAAAAAPATAAPAAPSGAGLASATTYPISDPP
jgi:lipid-binding SYLF domain-containing protein